MRHATCCKELELKRCLSRDGKLDDEALAAIKACCGILKRAPARQVSAAKKECFYLYTDASLEDGENGPCAGLGGVLVDPTGLPLQFFSWFPEQEDMLVLGIDLGTKCIFLLELLAVCIGFWLWGDVFGGSSLVFTDNEAAKACLVKGSSAHPIANKLLFCQAVLEVERMCLPWFSRVPSLFQHRRRTSRKNGREPLLEGIPKIDFNFAEFLVCFKKRGIAQTSACFSKMLRPAQPQGCKATVVFDPTWTKRSVSES